MAETSKSTADQPWWLRRQLTWAQRNSLTDEQLLARYKLDESVLELPPYDLLQAIGAKRGMLISGGEVDTERAAKMLVGEFRASKWGRLSLERPPHRDTAEEVDDYAEDDFPEDDPDFTDDED